jgi:hypothetical protein
MKPLWFGRRCGFAGRAGLLLLLALATGCGGPGKLSGRVLYNGKPVTGGWVTFRPADGRSNTVNAPIDENGNYEATLPSGEVKIAVDNRELQRLPPDRSAAGPALPPDLKPPAGVKPPPGVKPGSASPPPQENAPQKLPGTYVAIPEKYHDVDTSGLTYTVKSGPQPHDIELK